MSAGLREGRYFQRGLVPMKCLKRSCGVVLLSAMDFPGGSDGKESAYNAGDPGFNPWVGKISWRRKWQPTPVFLSGKSHGRRSLVGYSPWGRKESDTEWLHLCVSECRIGQCCLWLRSQPFLHPCEDWETHTGPSQVNRMASWELHEGLFCGRK